MRTMQEYCYKVCYKKQGKEKLKIYIITNSYSLAEWHIRWYKTHTPEDKKTKRLLENVTWIIVPVTSYAEYKYLWRDVPF